MHEYSKFNNGTVFWGKLLQTLSTLELNFFLRLCLFCFVPRPLWEVMVNFFPLVAEKIIIHICDCFLFKQNAFSAVKVFETILPKTR